MELIAKLAILADAAKYDASCASSGAKGLDSRGKDSRAKKGMGSTERMGICHSYAPDGRCISLLKILLTNFCIYDCLYCVNRHSSNVERARFSVEEVVQLTLNFYQRNYIEGLFLSSGVIQDPNYTMEQLIQVAKTLREQHAFKGYIHLKLIPDVDERLIQQAGFYADRLSVNIEMPTAQGLKTLAPQKDLPAIHETMATLRDTITEHKSAPKTNHNLVKITKPKRFAPGGQSTQMIVGADTTPDQTILTTSQTLYKGFGLRRVYYSAFSPIPDSSQHLPLQSPPLVREHRLYQADWLLRFYGFNVEEIVSGGKNGMLDLNVDPKLAWALQHREFFPIDINRASAEQLLRVPGLGAINVKRIIKSRRQQGLRLDDLKKIRVSLRKVSPFICTLDHHPSPTLLDSAELRQHFVPAPVQLDLFA
ncbi:MAG: putative DNA modification/repair radical SAM protein [Pseudomonadota bacterium]